MLSWINRVYTVVVNQDWLANLVSILEKVINGHKFDKKNEIGHKLVINFAYSVSRVCHISANSPFPSKSELVMSLCNFTRSLRTNLGETRRLMTVKVINGHKFGRKKVINGNKFDHVSEVYILYNNII